MTEILLIEHDEAIRELLAELLRDEGYVMVTAESTSDGLAQLEEATPAALLVSVGPGDRAEHQLITWCSAHARLAQLPIIVLTGGPWRFPECGSSVAAVVSKPFDIDELVSIVKRVADG